MVRIAGLVHMGKSTIRLNPFLWDRNILSWTVAGLLATLTAFTNLKAFVLDKYRWILYFLVTAVLTIQQPSMLVTAPAQAVKVSHQQHMSAREIFEKGSGYQLRDNSITSVRCRRRFKSDNLTARCRIESQCHTYEENCNTPLAIILGRKVGKRLKEGWPSLLQCQ